MPNLRIRDTFAGGNGHGLNVLAGGQYSYSNLDYPHFNNSRNLPSLTGILTAIAVIDRIPGEWWRDEAIALYAGIWRVPRQHIDRIREIQAAIAGGAA